MIAVAYRFLGGVVVGSPTIYAGLLPYRLISRSCLGTQSCAASNQFNNNVGPNCRMQTEMYYLARDADAYMPSNGASVFVVKT